MRAGWCARQERRVDEERALLHEATRWFPNALDERTVESDQRAIVIYLAEEVYRRCGEFAGAESLFEQARSEPMDDETRRESPQYIERQLALARAQDARNTVFEEG